MKLVNIKQVRAFFLFPGPNRSTLQAMLANLGNDEEMPALQSGSASPPRGVGGMNANNIPDIDGDDGKKILGL